MSPMDVGEDLTLAPGPGLVLQPPSLRQRPYLFSVPGPHSPFRALTACLLALVPLHAARCR